MTSKPGPMFADEQGTPVLRGQFQRCQLRAQHEKLVRTYGYHFV